MSNFFNLIRQLWQRFRQPDPRSTRPQESLTSHPSSALQDVQTVPSAVFQRGSMERNITLTQTQNKITVTVSNAQMLEIRDANGQMIDQMRSTAILTPQSFYLQPGEYQVVTDGQITDIVTAGGQSSPEPEFNQLTLTSDAKDFHVVDGIGEIPADGQSFTTITIRKLNSNGVPLQRDGDNEEIYLRTNAGIIKDIQGNQEIRSVQLNRGQGGFRLYSENHKRLATVQTVSANPFLADTSLNIEFF